MNSTIAIACLLLAPAGPEEAQAPPAGLDREFVKRATDRFGKHFVTVEVWLRRSEGEDPSRSKWVTAEYEEKRPLEVSGLLVDPRTIWMPEVDLERRFVARVAVRALTAKGSVPAALSAVFVRMPGWVVRAERPIPDIEPLAFAAFDGRLEGLISIGAAFARGERILTVSKVGGEFWRLGDGLWAQVKAGVLIADRELRPVGYSASGYLGIENAPDIWRGAEIAGGPLLDLEAFDRSKEAIAKEAAPWALTVRGFFRHEEEEAEGRRGRRFRYRSVDDVESRNEFLACGYAVDPRIVLVNYGLEQEAAMRLERIAVKVGGEDRPARFLGAFRRFRAFLAELEGDPLPASLNLSSGATFSISQPLVSFAADHGFGKRREIVDLNRIIDLARGYRGITEPLLQKFPRPGALFLDVESHAFLGAALEVTRESDEDDSGRSFRSRGSIDLRILRPSEIRELIEEKAFDPRIRPRPAEREKDMVWLGVDTQPLSRDLTKSLGVEIPTRGGEIGLMVLAVNPGSPAALAGLAPGDILLSLGVEDEPEPFELKAHGEYGREELVPDFSPEDIPEEEQAEFFANAGPPWRSPRNFLNEKLTRIGEGRKVELAYLRDGKEEKAAIALAQAPPDFESAARYKAEDLGLTVKELTYEVRSHYRLKDDAPGVVVAKVERGGKAAIAKVLPYEILVSVNGKVVRSVEEFRKILEEVSRSPAGERILELKLEKMGKSRLVRIRP